MKDVDNLSEYNQIISDLCFLRCSCMYNKYPHEDIIYIGNINIPNKSPIYVAILYTEMALNDVFRCTRYYKCLEKYDIDKRNYRYPIVVELLIINPQNIIDLERQSVYYIHTEPEDIKKSLYSKIIFEEEDLREDIDLDSTVITNLYNRSFMKEELKSLIYSSGSFGEAERIGGYYITPKVAKQLEEFNNKDTDLLFSTTIGDVKADYVVKILRLASVLAFEHYFADREFPYTHLTSTLQDVNRRLMLTYAMLNQDQTISNCSRLVWSIRVEQAHNADYEQERTLINSLYNFYDEFFGVLFANTSQVTFNGYSASLPVRYVNLDDYVSSHKNAKYSHVWMELIKMSNWWVQNNSAFNTVYQYPSGYSGLDRLALAKEALTSLPSHACIKLDFLEHVNKR